MSDVGQIVSGEAGNAEETPDDAKSKTGKSSDRVQVKKPGKRGRKPAKIDVKAKLERSRQSARECRARKKLRYQYLEELSASRERAIFSLREELDQLKKWCGEVDKGHVPKQLRDYLAKEKCLSPRSTASEQSQQGELN